MVTARSHVTHVFKFQIVFSNAGYDWNKYNQTHYDYDNPPPKTVVGYKFNILYHDLIGGCYTNSVTSQVGITHCVTSHLV